ncbi:hypothetical protein K6119_08980 [Paracrocinitomix mangrovi]|uniref:hypothetical protein n=1 Tax=Paracrocinitomix mangrovi TaxID=2862509 RepID=UPI001C8D6AC4|nr:hypothetical protein [Paracrocinitomix mangrovi]UKN03645.1 hypothetical protein K6119_08980 [Paracrocinitomix mangrovi]
MKHIILFSIIISTSIVFGQKTLTAIDKCDVGALEKAIAAGYDINEKFMIPIDEGADEIEANLLSYAVHGECLDAVNYLIERKDQLTDFDLILTEAFIYSLSVGNDEISSVLYAQNPLPKGICDICHGNNAIMVAATYGREDWYNKLKDQSDLSYINHSGANLVTAASSGSSQAILKDVLQSTKLDLNKKDNEGLTPLDYAASNSDNKEAFNTLVKFGADIEKSWNLLYWWTMYPDLELTEDIIKKRKNDVWMIDEDGDNCLMLLSYFYVDFIEKDKKFEKVLLTIIDIMKEGYENGEGNYDYVKRLYYNKINVNYLNAMLLTDDYTSESPIYPKYLELLSVICEKNDFCPVYKKEYKKACKIYGKEVVTDWYTKYSLPMD